MKRRNEWMKGGKMKCKNWEKREKVEVQKVQERRTWGKKGKKEKNEWKKRNKHRDEGNDYRNAKMENTWQEWRWFNLRNVKKVEKLITCNFLLSDLGI